MDAIQVHMLGRQAAEAFVQRGIPLSKTVADIAEAQKLNPAGIKRIVGAANHQADALMRATALDKTYHFELASSKDVVELLKDKDARVDVSRVVGTLKKHANDAASARIDAWYDNRPMTAMEKEAACMQLRRDLTIVAKELENLVREDTVKLAAAERELRSELEGLVEDVKQHILQDGGNTTVLHKIACTLDGNEEMWDQVFSYVGDALVKMGEPFNARMKYMAQLQKERPEAFKDTPPSLTVDVINGQNKYVARLKRIHDKLTIAEKIKYWKNNHHTLETAVRTDTKQVGQTDDIDLNDYGYAAAMRRSAEDGELRNVLEKLDDQSNNGSLLDKFRESLQLAENNAKR